MKAFSRIVAVVGLSAMLASPAMAHGRSLDGSSSLSLGFGRKLFNMEQRDEMKAFKEEQKEEKRAWRTARNEEQKVEKQATAECMKPAIVKREDALIAAQTKMSTAFNAALVARKTALLSAWDKTVLTERVAALTDAWKNYRTSVTTARNAFRTSKIAAWSQYGVERKACGSDVTGVEAQATVSVDAQI